MVPVEQTIFEPPHSNCMAACIASILELPLDAVPNLGGRDDWFFALNDWLRGHNLTMLNFPHGEGGYLPRGYTILTGDSPRGPWLHAVVAFDGVICWDPSPDRIRPIGTWRDWTVFQVLDPANRQVAR